MTSNIQLAKASRPAEGKGEDSVFCFRLNASDCFLMGVADGLSRANGGDAARWIEQTMEFISTEFGTEAMSARQLCDRFQELLQLASSGTRRPDSLSTLSCGIGRVEQHGDVYFIRFHFFGIGDSPIWRVTPYKPNDLDELDFQASPVYGPPVPSEQGGVYSTVNLGQGKIDGTIHFGTVDINEGEILIVATDGLPESRIFYDDQDPNRNTRSPQLIGNLLRSKSFDDATLADAIAAYDSSQLLIDDDASLVVARLISTRPFIAENFGEVKQIEPALGSSYHLADHETCVNSNKAASDEFEGTVGLPATPLQLSSKAAAQNIGSPAMGEEQSGLSSVVEPVFSNPGGKSRGYSTPVKDMTPRPIMPRSSKQTKKKDASKTKVSSGKQKPTAAAKGKNGR